MACTPPVGKRWCFTWNNPPDNWQEVFLPFRNGTSGPKLLQCVAYREVGASGTPHIQGFLVFNNTLRLSYLKRTFGTSIHFEVARGTNEEAAAYCRKDGSDDHIDYDDHPGRGARTDLSAAAGYIRDNGTRGLKRLAMDDPGIFVKYHAGFTALARTLAPKCPLHYPRTVHWFYGDAGTGKTYTAKAEATRLAIDDDDIYLWNTQNLKFADGYNGQLCVIIDELRPTWENYTYARLLSLTGSEGGNVEIKGASVPWMARNIWITTPFIPEVFFTNDPHSSRHESMQQLQRRITETRRFTVVHADAYASDRASDAAAAPPEPVATTPTFPRLPPLPVDVDSDSSRPEDELLAQTIELSDCDNE